jgi:26S proteasome regulatory subunit T1
MFTDHHHTKKSDRGKPDKKKKEDDEEDAPRPLDEDEIALLKNYGIGPYTTRISALEQELEKHKQTVIDLVGIRESDTGLSQLSEWDLIGDKQMMQEESPLHVAHCTKILTGEEKKNKKENGRDPSKLSDGGTGEEDKKMYVIKIEHYARFVVGLGEKVSPTDIEEGMRVGVDQHGLSIQIPLPSKIDTSVSLMTVEEKPDVTYDDVGGAREAMERLREVMELPLLHPERFISLGIDPPKGVLLYGPPGTGKTLAARAVANRTDACFIRVIGSELVRKYVGEGARMVRELFAMARTKRACIVFFDEIDAIGGARHGGDEEGGDNEVQRTMLQIATELDGFDARGNIKVLMATNRPDILDPSLVRPGRLDRKVEFSLPDLEGRKQILHIHCKSIRIDRDIRFELIARLCPNTTGADLRSVCTEAGMFCLRARRKTVSELDFLASVQKVIKGYKKFSSTPKYMVYN